jgi:hypothetical protein
MVDEGIADEHGRDVADDTDPTVEALSGREHPAVGAAICGVSVGVVGVGELLQLVGVCRRQGCSNRVAGLG